MLRLKMIALLFVTLMAVGCSGVRRTRMAEVPNDDGQTTTVMLTEEQREEAVEALHESREHNRELIKLVSLDKSRERVLARAASLRAERQKAVKVTTSHLRVAAKALAEAKAAQKTADAAKLAERRLREQAAKTPRAAIVTNLPVVKEVEEVK